MADGKKWLAYGCFGCAGIVALFLLIAGIVGGTALLQVRGEKVEKQVLTQDLPPFAPVAATGGGPSGAAPAAKGGRVILETSRVELEIVPAEPGEPLRVEATFDEQRHELEQGYEAGDDGGWSYRLRFAGKGSSLIGGLRAMFGATQPRARLFLPVDVPLSLELLVAEGGAQVELGGLWLTRAEFELDKGGLQLEVDRPLREPMEHLSLRGAMGGLQATRLGNASPRSLDVDFSMGGVELDLRGEWVADSDITIRMSMGGGLVRLPNDVRVEGIDSGRVAPEPDAEIDLPTLRFDASSSMGDLEIMR